MSRPPQRIRILFLCTGNSCRSQMAEGLARALKGGLVEAYSAGVAPQGLDPRAVEVMAELGIDISGQRSQGLEEFRGRSFDYVVTLCDHARQSCPAFPGPARRLHLPLEDPPLAAAGAAGEEEALAPYRRVRDHLRAWVEGLPGVLEASRPQV